MPQQPWSQSSPAWYFGTREEFLATPTDSIANQLAGRAADESFDIEPEQSQEWRQSVGLLQEHLAERLPILREALIAPGNEAIRHVILEYDFRRRGLRMDCLLLADGVLFVVEFKRSKVQRADRDQVMSYAVNLVEFHKVTRAWCEVDNAIVVPILALTVGKSRVPVAWPGLAGHSWRSLANRPMECDPASLRTALGVGLLHRQSSVCAPRAEWLGSSFRPSSSILDATLSLYGNHDVASIEEHAAPAEAIASSVREIEEHIDHALSHSAYHIVFLSGAPGAGKTLVGLNIVMRGRHAADAVFVTGNAPLVDVLNQALKGSYRAQGQRDAGWTPTGYRRSDARHVIGATDYKIVKAHNFLGRRSGPHRQEDGRVLVFDEAQRTYEKGREVLRQKLEDHEADLILRAQRTAFPSGGAVVIALVGHNQAINRGERGIVAWLEAAANENWTYSIADATLALAEFEGREKWTADPRRKRLENGHLLQSMRFYRNAAVEEWASAVLANGASQARAIAANIGRNGDTIWISRNIGDARTWARQKAVGGQRAGLIASGQARRLAAEGLFVDYKPDIRAWMLAPSSDIRSSTALETVQNQYQIQGLELDYCIVCWDADLRRQGDSWAAFKLSGSDWQQDTLIEVAKNGYRVLLTRARKGMVVFVPAGDLSGEDTTRDVAFYDGIAAFLRECGATELGAADDEATLG